MDRCPICYGDIAFPRYPGILGTQLKEEVTTLTTCYSGNVGGVFKRYILNFCQIVDSQYYATFYVLAAIRDNFYLK